MLTIAVAIALLHQRFGSVVFTFYKSIGNTKLKKGQKRAFLGMERCHTSKLTIPEPGTVFAVPGS